MTKILVVEDELILLQALAEKLKSEYYEVVEAHDGQEGLTKALKEHPDLILLDIIMPIMDGMTMLNKLREDEWGRTVPVIILTNLSGGDQVAEALGKGVYHYLIKSDWTLDQLVQKIKERLGLV